MLALAGCSTVPRSSDNLPPPEVMVVQEDSAPSVEPATTQAPRSTPATAPIPQAQPAAEATHLRFPAGTWIPLDAWCHLNGFGQLRPSGSGANVVFSFSAKNGAISVHPGSQLAYWNGLEFRLGFAPQLTGGQVLMHELDLRKNFAPLLEARTLLKSHPVLVIDPGHGGIDTGTRNIANGHYEKEFTLDWARRLQAILVTNGWTVWLTRTNDINLPLPSRVAFAAQHNADIFLSLHFNSSFPDRGQSGLETYCLTPSGMPSNLTRGFRDDARLVFPNNTFDSENLQLAMQLHRALLSVNGHDDRGVRRARFLGVLQNQNRPAVLVEGAYLSNPREATEIADPAHRQRLADALARALLEESRGALTVARHDSAPGVSAQ